MVYDKRKDETMYSHGNAAQAADYSCSKIKPCQ